MARSGAKSGNDSSQNNLDPNYVPSGAPGLAPSFSSEPSDDLVSIREQVDQVLLIQDVISGKMGLARLSM